MATVDYAGKIFTMESFTGTTDGSGDLVVNLVNTPTDDASILIFCTTALTTVEFVSRATAAVTLRFRNKKYDKTDRGGAGVGSVDNQPGGVTLVTGNSFSTGSQGSVTSIADTGGQSFTVAHAHTVTSMFQHDHTFTVTNLPIVNAGAVDVTVGYAF